MTDERCQVHSEKIHGLELNMVEVRGDVKHIRERIDNGISATITGMDKKFDELNLRIAEEIIPVCEDSKLWVGRMKSLIWWIATGGILTFFSWIGFYLFKIAIG